MTGKKAIISDNGSILYVSMKTKTGTESGSQYLPVGIKKENDSSIVERLKLIVWNGDQSCVINVKLSKELDAHVAEELGISRRVVLFESFRLALKADISVALGLESRHDEGREWLL